MPEEARTIELDCPPGFPRPGDLIGGVIEGTGLPEIAPCSMLFGEWTYDYTNLVTAEKWAEVQPILKERITALYNAGAIRYGSW